jgi:hypothetical protein
MSNRSFLVGILVVGLLLLGGWWFWKSKRVPPVEAPAKAAPASSVNTVAHSGTTSQPGTPADKSALAAQIAALEQNPKVKAIEAAVAKMNAASQYFYGKIIDQYGHPVAGATATGTLMQMEGVDTGTKKDFYTTQSDDNGCFEFTNLHGWQLGVVVKKDGYEMGQGAGFYEAPNAQDKTSSEQRAIFHMWKLQGAEPMVHTKFDSRVPYDGQTAAFDILAGRKASSGDLQITLTRNPLQVQRGGAPFDWSVQIQVAGGGLVETSDLYPDEAPEGGYQPMFAFSMTKDAANWTQRLTQTYYIHTANGDYGRVNIDLTTDSERPQGTGITIETWLNPVPGDRNLEYDPAQAIKP